ncbi:MAG: hypothetical protein ACJ77B_11465 [Chloroflexota bacterium]
MPTVRHAPGRERLLAIAAGLVLLVGMLPGTVAAVAPSGTPSLLTPTEGQTVSSNPTLTWTAVTGAVKYRVQISASSGFSPLVYNVDTTNRKATPPNDLPLGTLYWRVAATDGASGIGSFQEGTFVKQWGTAPTLLAPADAATLDFPTEPVLFSWQPLAGASSYTLEVDDAADFIGASSFTTPNTNYTLTEPQTVDQTFFWHLRATSSTGGVVSDWSATRQYTYTWSSVPTLVTPDNTTLSSVTDLVFSWTPVVGAKTYELQISPNGNWANNLVPNIPLIKGTRYSPAVTLDNGSYFWRVRARDAKNTPNNGGWSEEWQFTRGWSNRPSVVSPAWSTGDPATVVATNMTFAWTPVPNASHYELQTSHDINFSPGDSTTKSCYTNHTTFTPYTHVVFAGEPGACNLLIGDTGSTYYWRVRGIDNAKGVLGLWSQTSNADTARFIRVPEMPTPISPATGSDVEVPSLSWTPVTNAEHYIVTVTKSNKSTPVGGTPKETFATSFTPTAALVAADGPFYWHVEAVRSDGTTSNTAASSSWPSFTVATPTPVSPLTLTTPGDGDAGFRMPQMTWDPYPGATYYKVRWGSGAFTDPTPLSGSTKLPYAGFTYPDLTVSPGTYFWYVTAFDDSDALLATSFSSDFVIDPLSTVAPSGYTAPAKCAALDVCTAERDTPQLTWDPVDWAGAYEVTIANDANFTNVVRQYSTSYTVLTPRESLVDNQAGQAFYWFVRPCIDEALSRCAPGSDDSTANDNASAFQKQSKAIALTSPANSSTVANLPTFDWTDFLTTNQTAPFVNGQEARTYKIQVSTVSDFATVLETSTSNVVVDQTTYTPYAITYPEGPLYWRVQAIDNSGNTLTVSPTRLVTKSSPALTTTHPTNGSPEPAVPYFAWTPQPFAATYTIEIYKNGDTLFSPANLSLSQTTKFAAWSPTTSMAAGAYAWRVRRNDADSRAGPWSAARTFTLGAAATTLVAPANAATVDAINFAFSWTGVSAAVKYRIEVAPTCGFASSTDAVTTVMTSWAPTKKYADGSYCWRVKSLDSSGNVLSTSATRTFSVGSVAPPPTVNPSTYVPVTPVRMLDSRDGTGLSGQFSANTARALQVAGRLGIPGTAVAVTGNLTVTNQSAPGYLSMTPDLTNNPSTSTLNFPLGDIRANNVTAPLNGAGKVSIVYKAPSGKKAHVIFDVTGYFLEDNSGATYKTLAPVRVLDTRNGTGLTGKFTSSSSRTWTVAGLNGIPVGAAAITGNLTVTNQSAGGYVSLGPVATNTPTTSTLNFPVGDIRANGVTVKLAADGSLSATYVGKTASTTHVLLDVTGYYVNDLTGAKFVPLTPARRLDTRNGTGLSGKFKANIGRTLAINGSTNVPSDAVALTGNLTVVNQTGAGFLSVTKVTTNAPTTSTLNFPLGDVRANGVTGPVTPAGNVGITYVSGSGKTTDVLLDVTGYFAP